MVALTDGARAGMELESSHGSGKSSAEFHAIIDDLLDNSAVTFSSQQRGENELSREAKRSLAAQLLSANKNLFLLKFGKHLRDDQLRYFSEFCNESDRGVEIRRTLMHLQAELDAGKMARQRRNRRYQALQELLANGTYFSEAEMMKRNPLLYNELVGQYLTDEERRARDHVPEQETTLVQVLMEGIERDDARELRKKQAEMEDNAMEEEDTSDEDERAKKEQKTEPTRKSSTQRNDAESPEQEAGHSQWGECDELADDRINHEEFHASTRTVEIASKQKALLRAEFTSVMYQSFLDGMDDFDYASVDNNESYDNLDIITQDEQDKYFDSEEPNELDNEELNANSGVSSEDELEMFMSRLHKSHPSICQ